MSPTRTTSGVVRDSDILQLDANIGATIANQHLPKFTSKKPMGFPTWMMRLKNSLENSKVYNHVIENPQLEHPNFKSADGYAQTLIIKSLEQDALRDIERLHTAKDMIDTLKSLYLGTDTQSRREYHTRIVNLLYGEEDECKSKETIGNYFARAKDLFYD